MKQQKNNQSTRPTYVRVICWILIVLMISSAIYYTIWGIQSLFSAIFADNAAQTQTKTVAISDYERPTDVLAVQETDRL